MVLKLQIAGKNIERPDRNAKPDPDLQPQRLKTLPAGKTENLQILKVRIQETLRFNEPEPGHISVRQTFHKLNLPVYNEIGLHVEILAAEFCIQ